MPVADPYRWLADPDSPATRAWVESQNGVTADYLAAIPTREEFGARLTSLWDHERFSAPFREGGRTFHYHNNGLQAQSVLYVQDAPQSAPRVLLDPNQFSADGTVALGGTAISRDGRWLACAAAANTARPGTAAGCCRTSRTPSTTSSPLPNISPVKAGRGRAGWPSTAAATGDSWSAPS